MHYIRPDGVADPQLLQLADSGRWWRLQLLHCTVDERRDGRGPRTGHAHNLYHIVLYTKADNLFLLHDQQVPSRPGILVLCPPGLPHDFGPQRPGQTSYDEITFQMADGEHLLKLDFNGLLSTFASSPIASLPLHAQLSSPSAARVRELIRRVTAEAISSAPLGLFRAHAALLDLFVTLADEFGHPPLADPIATAHRNLMVRFAQPVSITALADELGISSAHLSRAFRARYGLSPLAFRQDLRLTAAARLLQASSLSCKEIAARLGFADVQTFTKAFVRHHGHPPAQLARRLRA